MITVDHTLTRAGELLQIEHDHVAHNYHPLDVVVSRRYRRAADRHRGSAIPGFPCGVLGQ